MSVNNLCLVTLSTIGFFWLFNKAPISSFRQIISPTLKDTFPNNMVYVSGDTFILGDVLKKMPSEFDTTYQVIVGDFWISKFELTFDEFDEFCVDTKIELPDDSGWGRGSRPVINVDWYTAIEYCNWRSIREGLTPVYLIDKNQKDPNNFAEQDEKKWLVTLVENGSGYRLPTKFEWEYAARQAGQRVRFGNGRDVATSQEINYWAETKFCGYKYSVDGEIRQKTLPVGSFSPNELGIFDLSGNVSEWCQDWWFYKPGPTIDMIWGLSPEKSKVKVLKGGSWVSSPCDVTTFEESLSDPTDKNKTIGFRLAKNVAPNTQKKKRTGLIDFIAKIEGNMIPIPGGVFKMGGVSHEDALPIHDIRLDSFFIGKYEVTISEFQYFIDKSNYITDAEKENFSIAIGEKGYFVKKMINFKYNAKGDSLIDRFDKYPVVYVTWNDANEYCKWLSKKTGKTYRLPTEAEWEYASGNGSKHTVYSWGNLGPVGKVGGNIGDINLKKKFPRLNTSDYFTNYNDNYLYSAPKGSFQPNSFGLYDMTGNVWEHCNDWYQKDYYTISPKINPQGPNTGSEKVTRGGSWDNNPISTKVTYRSHLPVDVSTCNVGFRIVRTK